MSSEGEPIVISEAEPIDPSTGFVRNPWRGSWPEEELFRGFEVARKETERIFGEQFQEIQSRAPKELIREYETPQGDKVKEIGPLIYGYSIIIGGDGKPILREFGNIRPSARAGLSIQGRSTKPELIVEREPLIDVVTSDKEIKILVELPGVPKKDIRINAYKGSVGSVEIIAGEGNRKYKRVVELPADADVETARSTFNDGLLEITFDKTKKPERKGKQIKIE